MILMLIMGGDYQHSFSGNEHRVVYNVIIFALTQYSKYKYSTTLENRAVFKQYWGVDIHQLDRML